MKIFTCTEFSGHYPVGASAVIVDNSKLEAAATLEAKLRSMGLDQPISEHMLVEVDPNTYGCHILNDGNY